MLLARIRDIVEITEELLVAARRGDQDVPRVGRSHVGESVNNPFGHENTRSGCRDLSLISDEVLQLALQDDKQLVFALSDVGRCAEARLDGHIQHRERAFVRIDNFGRETSKFGRFEIRRDGTH
jgi:hypothetical protein